MRDEAFRSYCRVHEIMKKRQVQPAPRKFAHHLGNSRRPAWFGRAPAGNSCVIGLECKSRTGQNSCDVGGLCRAAKATPFPDFGLARTEADRDLTVCHWSPLSQKIQVVIRVCVCGLLPSRYVWASGQVAKPQLLQQTHRALKIRMLKGHKSLNICDLYRA